jgi:hypothetical protein
MSGFNVAIQGSSIVRGKHDPPPRSKKNYDFIPPLKRRKTVSTRCSCTFKISFTLAGWLIAWRSPSSEGHLNYWQLQLCSFEWVSSEPESAHVWQKYCRSIHEEPLGATVAYNSTACWNVTSSCIGPHKPYPSSLSSRILPNCDLVISNVRYKARSSILANCRQSSTNKEDSGTKSAIALPSDCLQHGEFVEGIASGGVTASQLPLDESPPLFIYLWWSHFPRWWLAYILRDWWDLFLCGQPVPSPTEGLAKLLQRHLVFSQSLFKHYIYSSSKADVQSNCGILRQSLPIKMIGYTSWAKKYMHTENHLSPTTWTESQEG